MSNREEILVLLVRELALYAINDPALGPIAKVRLCALLDGVEKEFGV